MIKSGGNNMSSTTFTAILVPLVALASALGGILLTSFFNRKTRKVEPELISAQADHEAAETAATFIKTSQGLVEMLDRQLRDSKSQHDEMQAKYNEIVESNDRLVEETRLLRQQEESCVRKLAEVTTALRTLQEQVKVLSEQVRTLGGDPEHLVPSGESEASGGVTGSTTVTTVTTDVVTTDNSF